MFEKLSSFKTFGEGCGFFDKYLEENYSLDTYEEDLIDVVYTKIINIIVRSFQINFIYRII